MSPSEADLRAALHAGDNDDGATAGAGGLDVDGIIAGGRARAQRRVRVQSIAAVVVLVAAAGTGSALVWGGGNGGGHPSADAARSAASRAGDAAGGKAAPSTAAGRAGTSVSGPDPALSVSCPPTMGRQRAPGGGSPGQFGSAGPLFGQPVASVVVCAYGSAAEAGRPDTVPTRTVLSGDDATALAGSLENASTKQVVHPCPSSRPADVHELTIIGVSADGVAMTPVTATLTDPACNVQVTNGTAVRYDWTPPAALQQRLTALRPRVAPSGLPVPNSTGPSIHGTIVPRHAPSPRPTPSGVGTPIR